MKLDFKLIWQFVRKELKWNVDFYSIHDYLARQGYSVVFFNTENGDKIVEGYNLSHYSKSTNAFTLRQKQTRFVFVDMNLSVENKIRSMLHEAAHIYLKHLDEDAGAKDIQLQEMQADAFAHGVIECAKIHKALVSTLKLSAPALLVSGLLLLGTILAKPEAEITNKNVTEITAPITNAVSESPEPEIVETDTSTVYVTPYGKKFHRSGCRYIKDKKCTTFSRDEALELYYTPCLICDP